MRVRMTVEARGRAGAAECDGARSAKRRFACFRFPTSTHLIVHRRELGFPSFALKKMALRASRFFSTRGSAGRVSPRARHRTRIQSSFSAPARHSRANARQTPKWRASALARPPGFGFAPAPAAAGRRAGDPSRTVKVADASRRIGSRSCARAGAAMARMRAQRDFQTVASWENLGVRFTPRIARGAPPDPRRRRPRRARRLPDRLGDLAATSPRAPPLDLARRARVRRRVNPGFSTRRSPRVDPLRARTLRQAKRARKTPERREARSTSGEGGAGRAAIAPAPLPAPTRDRGASGPGARRGRPRVGARLDRPARLVRERTPRPNAPGRAPRARSIRSFFKPRRAPSATDPRRVPPSKTPEKEVFLCAHSCLCLSSPTRSFSSNPAEPNRSNTLP